VQRVSTAINYREPVETPCGRLIKYWRHAKLIRISKICVTDTHKRDMRKTRHAHVSLHRLIIVCP